MALDPLRTRTSLPRKPAHVAELVTAAATRKYVLAFVSYLSVSGCLRDVVAPSVELDQAAA